MTPHARRQFAKNSSNYEARRDSRWREADENTRQSAIFFDLVARENRRAREITRHMEKKDTAAAERLVDETTSPFLRLNELLRIGGLAVTLENSNDEELLARHENAAETYSIAQMSDGERSAALTAAFVLTLEDNVTVLIDEPELRSYRWRWQDPGGMMNLVFNLRRLAWPRDNRPMPSRRAAA